MASNVLNVFAIIKPILCVKRILSTIKWTNTPKVPTKANTTKFAGINPLDKFSNICPTKLNTVEILSLLSPAILLLKSIPTSFTLNCLFSIRRSNRILKPSLYSFSCSSPNF